MEDQQVLQHIATAVLATLRGLLHVRGSFSSTSLVLSLGVASAGPPATDKADSLRVALLAPGAIWDRHCEAYRGLRLALLTIARSP